MQALLAVGEPAHEAIAGVTEGGDVLERWIVGRHGGRGQHVELAAHRSPIAEQGRDVLDLLHSLDRVDGAYPAGSDGPGSSRTRAPGFRIAASLTWFS